MNLKKLISTIILCLLISSIQAQNPADLVMARKISQPVKKRTYAFAYNNSNEVMILLSGLFLGYKSFLSSQDGQSCGFTPSCSEYGLLCMKKHGFIKGLLATSDRIQRCNGLNRTLYPVSREGLFIDEP